MTESKLNPFDAELLVMIGDKGCGNCANFTNEDVNGNGYCEAFKCEQSCGVMPCQEYKPKNQ